MPVQPGKRYDAVVLISMMSESEGTGRPCIYFKFRTEDGRIDHYLYLSDKTDVNVAKTMSECFGIDRRKLGELLKNDTIGTVIKGHELSITTELKTFEDRNGKSSSRVIVKWMNPIKLPKRAGQRALDFAGKLFGVKPAPTEKKQGGFGGIDDDLPPDYPVSDDDVPY